MTSPPLLDLIGLSKSFAGVRALDDVGFAIAKGEVVCLAGENGSGKSTLIKIVAGAQPADAGSIAIDGQVQRRWSPMDAVRAGIQVIFQDFALFPNLSVAENIALNQELSAGHRFINWKAVRAVARRGLERVGVDIPLDQTAETLPVADKQLVAIARALLSDARLIIMDEPTTALTEREVRHLLDIIRRLRDDGVSVLFVSHKLNEVFDVCDKIVVLRNGRRVAAGTAAEFDISSLTRHMTGRDIAAESHRRAAGADARELLRVEGLTKHGAFADIAFSLKAGEVLGITGLLGSGRTQLAKALFGLTPVDGGCIAVDGRPAAIASPQDAIAHGIGYVPEDRLTEGLFLSQPIAANIVVGTVDRHTGGGGLLDRHGLKAEARRWIDKLKVLTPSPDLPVQSLSGGNQQRVVLARWLATNPKILILNGPTVGVDVGSKAEIHAIVAGLADAGIGIIVISDDIPEILGACARILVMRAGRITDEVSGEVSADDLALRLAS
ncbi:MAG: sugar ABC transporter ATP-binding protein [Rhodospirillaceae bacterium]|nr:sugar ABC transporter ATP-binding protein [Rhodospirillaceae bacterium]